MNPLAMLLIAAGIAFAGNVNSIGPIHITGNAGFATCGCARLAGGVWVIGPWSISGAPGDGVLIENVTVPFQLLNMTVNKSSGAGIHLNNVNGGGATVIAGIQTSLQNNNIGIVIENSANLAADGGGPNPNDWGPLPTATPHPLNKTLLADDVVNL